MCHFLFKKLLKKKKLHYWSAFLSLLGAQYGVLNCGSIKKRRRELNTALKGSVWTSFYPLLYLLRTTYAITMNGDSPPENSQYGQITFKEIYPHNGQSRIILTTENRGTHKRTNNHGEINSHIILYISLETYGRIETWNVSTGKQVKGCHTNDNIIVSFITVLLLSPQH